MNDRDIQRRLKNFTAVWARVLESKAATGSAKLMPRKEKSYTVRFDPRQK